MKRQTFLLPQKIVIEIMPNQIVNIILQRKNNQFHIIQIAFLIHLFIVIITSCRF